MAAANFAAPAVARAQPYPPTYMGGFRWAGPEADLRITVKPREASVYVDGYFAGKVDDFDGALQRLHVTPGQHEIVIYLEGHRSLRQQLYLTINRTHRIDGVLEPLEPGAPADPLPVPDPRDAERRAQREAEANARPPMPQGGQMPRAPVGRGGPPRPLPPSASEPPPPAREPLPPSDSRFGTLSIGVRPSDSSITIDGETWKGPSDDEQLIIQVAEGRHRIEVSKDGYVTYSADIEIERGRTRPLNISLERQP
jgi:hypothetical protein